MSVTDTPKGSTYFKPKKMGAMEVTSRGDFVLYCLDAGAARPGARRAGLEARAVEPQACCRRRRRWAAYIALAGYYAHQVYDTWRINKDVFSTPVPDIHRYKFRQVAVLDLAYSSRSARSLPSFRCCRCSSRTRSASRSPRPASWRQLRRDNLFRAPRRRLAIAIASAAATCCSLCLAGTAAGYLAMSRMAPDLGIAYAVAATFICSLFVNAGNGAVYAMLPMIKRRLTGQIAGMVGAYGNVGGVLFLTLYSFVSVRDIFSRRSSIRS